MKILSIDVGVKNLAVCLFDVSDKDNYKILMWSVVDLENTVIYKCDGLCNKTKKICNKKASYEKNGLFYCKTHAKQTKFIIPSKELNPVKLKKLKLTELNDVCKKYDILTVEQHAVKILKSDLIVLVDKYISDTCFMGSNQTTNKQRDLITLGRSLQTSFDSIFNEHVIDTVIIENQISPIANNMKTIQGMIAQYFIMKNVPEIKFVSAKNKLKHFEKSEEKSSYSERKKLSIKICRDIIVAHPTICNNHLEIFDKSNKKDDFADSFLQGLVYLADLNIIHFKL